MRAGDTNEDESASVNREPIGYSRVYCQSTAPGAKSRRAELSKGDDMRRWYRRKNAEESQTSSMSPTYDPGFTRLLSSLKYV